MKSILDPTFHYIPSTQTDLRKTFSRIRREMAKAKSPSPVRGPSRVVPFARNKESASR